jgi:tetratricopeptide (TPR) repeat protein
MEYDAFELNPKPYHVTNLILHLLNSLLVLYFIWLLTKQKWTAFITALLFAVHPMHVESVSWISERKDLLYTFFSLATLCYYLKYLQNQKLKWLYYSVSFFLFLLAVLSKAMAVSVPLVFILLDYFSGKRFTLKAILDKIPFFIISIVCGLIALEAQKSSHAIHFSSFNFFERILFSCYGILMYLWKLLLPYNLSCYYNYPLKQNGMFPVVFYLAPFILIGLSWIIYKSMRNSKDVVFGFAFFLITIALVLQIIPVGGIIIADRYTYIPYIGIFFILARFINNLTDNKIVVLRKYKIPFILMFSVIIFSYCYAAFQRTQVWADSISLWTDAINKYDKYPLPYSLRGTAYYKRGQHENAISDFSNAISLNQGQANVYFQRGLCYLEIKKYNEAIRDFSSAIGIKPAYADAYYNRGVVYNDTGLFDEAIIDYSSAIKYNPGHSKAYYNRAGAYYMSHKYQLAYDDVLIAQKLGFEIMPGFIEAIKAALNQQAANSIRNL